MEGGGRHGGEGGARRQDGEGRGGRCGDDGGIGQRRDEGVEDGAAEREVELDVAEREGRLARWRARRSRQVEEEGWMVPDCWWSPEMRGSGEGVRIL